MNVFKGIIGFLTLLPYITAGAEKLHDAQSGPEKKAAVMNLANLALTSAAMEVPDSAEAIKDAAPDIGKAIDGIVGALNTLGIFGHKSKPEPKPEPQPAAS